MEDIERYVGMTDVSYRIEMHQECTINHEPTTSNHEGERRASKRGELHRLIEGRPKAIVDRRARGWGVREKSGSPPQRIPAPPAI